MADCTASEIDTPMDPGKLPPSAKFTGNYTVDSASAWRTARSRQRRYEKSALP